MNPENLTMTHDERIFNARVGEDPKECGNRGFYIVTNPAKQRWPQLYLTRSGKWTLGICAPGEDYFWQTWEEAQAQLLYIKRLMPSATAICPVVVYRVQDRDGRGPFKPGFSQVWFEDRTDEEYAALAPWPLECISAIRKASFGKVGGFACETLDQLRRWFTPNEYKTLLQHGYRAVKLEADAVLARSETQCAFVRSRPLQIGVEEINLHQ